MLCKETRMNINFRETREETSDMKERRRFHSRCSTWLHNIYIERTCLTKIFRTPKRACGSSINVSHIEKGTLRDSDFSGTSVTRSNSPRFCGDLHRESIPLSWISYPYLHLLGSDLQYLSARDSTLFSICISFISRLVISSVSFV